MKFNDYLTADRRLSILKILANIPQGSVNGGCG